MFPAAIQRLLYYPPLEGRPADDDKPGIGVSGCPSFALDRLSSLQRNGEADKMLLYHPQEHTDYEVFTVLRQDNVGGLEVKNLSGDCEYP
jgi:isopenicillin N synthase-like dioxygenase